LIAEAEKEAQSLCSEYATTDPTMSITIEYTKVDTLPKALPKAETQKYLDLITTLPCGVVRMSSDIEGLVETSNNTGVARVKNGKATVICLSRSSVNDSLNRLEDLFISYARLSGAEFSGRREGYSGWKPNPKSHLLAVCKAVMTEDMGKEPIVEAIHAGLECGEILGKYPHIEAISIGPTVKEPHTDHECLQISTVKPTYDQTVELLKRLAA
ncbi:peptidase M20C, Xaa-His dipeptidase, partial [Kipferlia bialata]